MKITFHRFNMTGDDDPTIMVAELIWQWQKTQKGVWVMENAHDLTWHHQTDNMHWGYDVIIRGEIRDPRKITKYMLRWPEHQ